MEAPPRESSWGTDSHALLCAPLAIRPRYCLGLRPIPRSSQSVVSERSYRPGSPVLGYRGAGWPSALPSGSAISTVSGCRHSGVMGIAFVVQGDPAGREDWLTLAKRAEELGFEALSIADHPGVTASPFVMLAAAAQVTTRVRLATAVANAGVWEPLALAAEVATLNVVSDGRAVLGIGAGHTPVEWTQVGRVYPSADERVGHLEAVITSVRRLLAGERVTVQQAGVHLQDAALGWPLSSQRKLPVLVGGNARGLVRLAARCGDGLELTGLGRTLPDGHAHEAKWSTSGVDERVRLFHASGGRSLGLGALVQKVEITNNRDDAAEDYQSRLATVLPADVLPTIGKLLNTPFVMFGTVEEVAAQLRKNQVRWGFSRYTTRAADVDQVANVIEYLAVTR